MRYKRIIMVLIIAVAAPFTAKSQTELKPTPGLIFKVRIGTYTDSVDRLVLSSWEKALKSEVEYQPFATSHKTYYTGSFTDYSRARNEKERLVEAGIIDAFVVAFYNGERVEPVHVPKIDK